MSTDEGEVYDGFILLRSIHLREYFVDVLLGGSGGVYCKTKKKKKGDSYIYELKQYLKLKEFFPKLPSIISPL